MVEDRFTVLEKGVVKKNLLWIGDACVPSGFANATHNTLDWLEPNFNITVLGLNYRGDPYNYPYDVYAAQAGGDWAGIGRLIWMCDVVKKKFGSLDVIVIQNDPWNIPMYTKWLRKTNPQGEYLYPEYANVPIVGSIAVDGKNCDGAQMNDLALGVFWTQFGLDEARQGGFTKPGVVIPLGVNLNVYKPMPKIDALSILGIPEAYKDVFIVGNVNRNQPRKRLDLTIKYFAEWVKANEISAQQAALLLHVAPTGDTGVDITELMKYYGIIEYLLLSTPEMFYGKSEIEMCATYNAMDVLITTTQGEGMGLTTMEAMACGVPCIVPDWAALGEWAKDAAICVPCTSTAIGPPYVNVIGGIPDERQFIGAMHYLFTFEQNRRDLGKLGIVRMGEDRFRWSNIGHAFNDAIVEIIN